MGNRYYPSTFSDVGSRTTTNPASAYDGNLTTFASVGGSVSSVAGTPPDVFLSTGDCIFQGDPAVTLPGTSTLTVVAGVTSLGQLGTDWSATITGTIGGTTTTMASINAATTSATYTLTVPASTSLSTISVEASVDPGSISGSNGARTVTLKIYEIYVQS